MAKDLLHEMKSRELYSYQWQEDIIKPLASEFKTTTDDMNEIFLKNLDMSQIDALHATFESSKHEAIYRKLYADLHLHWFIEVLDIINIEDANKIILPSAKKILNGTSYEIGLNECRNELLEVLRGL